MVRNPWTGSSGATADMFPARSFYKCPRDICGFAGSEAPSNKVGVLAEHFPPSDVYRRFRSRHGILVEDRDPHRLKDKNGAPVLCFQCGMSALPTGLASMVPASKRPRRSTSKAVTPEAFKDILSCDFCSLHWHLDCLNPPLSSMPPFNRKWMCPNHAEKLIVSASARSMFRAAKLHPSAFEAKDSETECTSYRYLQAKTVE